MKTTLSPKDLALAIGVSESSLKRWVDEGALSVTRTAGGHRRIAIAEAVRFVRETCARVVRPDLLGFPEISGGAAPGRRHDYDELLYTALAQGQATQARGMVLALYLRGQTLASLFDGPIRAAMHRLGDLWRHDVNGVFIEHRATDICIQIVGRLREMVPPPVPDAPAALGAAAAHDPYLLPTAMAAAIVADAGFNAVNLGPDTPLNAMARAIDHHHPRLVWLSASVAGDFLELQKQIGGVASHLGESGAVLALGGRAIPPRAYLRDPVIHYVATMGELAAFARGVRTGGSGGGGGGRGKQRA